MSDPIDSMTMRELIAEYVRIEKEIKGENHWPTRWEFRLIQRNKAEARRQIRKSRKILDVKLHPERYRLTHFENLMRPFMS